MKESYLYDENRLMTLRLNSLGLVGHPKTLKNLHSLNDEFYDLIEINVYQANAALKELKTLVSNYENRGKK